MVRKLLSDAWEERMVFWEQLYAITSNLGGQINKHKFIRRNSTIVFGKKGGDCKMMIMRLICNVSYMGKNNHPDSSIIGTVILNHRAAGEYIIRWE